MSKVIYAPNDVGQRAPNLIDIFLAGSIEMGLAKQWQEPLGEKLSELPCINRIFNPRRLDFDASQEQTFSNPYFNGQVTWELDNLEQSTVVFMYFDPATKSPITLAELGFLLGTQKSYTWDQQHLRPEIIVCCPDGYWRKGNVEVMISRADSKYITLFNDYETAEKYLIQRIWSKHKILSNAFNFFPFGGYSESQRVTELYEGFVRGTKIPKDFEEQIKERDRKKRIVKL